MLVQGTTVGIEADGQGMVVRNNRILDIGPGVSLAIGIYVNGGSSGHVHDNEIVNMLGNSKTSPWGIEVFNSPGTTVQRNVISRQPGSGGATVYGIIFSNTSGNTAVDNRVYGYDHGIAWLSPSTGLYRDNTVGGASVPYSG